ncbi:uncharacterized protein LOC107981965 [Nasonia vitripennis]|uniref:Uncharacterized protein n=1 Tax=Nasonia vitripennis TaxID=7425 RepID=A0A7M7IWP0_NASVI|nr:uncharacterized protein LOC107981965 [Nasonia vitripennis]
MTNLFKLFNVIFKSPVMPDSRYCVDKLLNPKESAEFHAVYHNCSAYIGKLGEIASVKVCQICQEELKDHPSNTSFFVIIDPSTQIKDLVNFYEDHYDYVISKRISKPGFIEDVYDGKEYRAFVNSLPQEDKYSYLTAVFNTDGAPKFKSSQYSIWPLYLMLNELPKQERMNKLITCGLWFNKKKPDMSVFLSTFVDAMNKLTNEGISCNVKNENKLVKLCVVTCCVDSVARAPIQGLKQFNGKCACNWCLHPGEWAEGSMRYPLLTYSVDCREHEKTVSDMMIATPDNPIDGIKYPSPLINLANFNIISGFIVDYLHCSLEGVASQFTEYHLMSMIT